jgi:hypothetical protein
MASLSAYYPLPVVAGITAGTYAEGDDSRIVGALPSSTAGSGSVLASGSNTARTLSARFADSVNVKDFGAVGNGIANDAPAIRSAVAYAVANNKAVFFPSGTYELATFTDGTGSYSRNFGSTGLVQKDIINVLNTTNTERQLILLGEKAVLTSGLWGNDENPAPNNSYINFFWVEGKINVYCENIIFKSRFGGTGERPLKASSQSQTRVPFANTYAFHLINNGGKRGQYSAFYDCEFWDFFTGLKIYDSENVYFVRNYCRQTWGAASAGSSNGGEPMIAGIFCASGGEAIQTAYIDGNIGICGPTDFSPIANIASGDFTVFRCGDGPIAIGGQKKRIITNNSISYFTYEAINDFGFNSPPIKNKSYSLISNNIIDGTSPLGGYTRNGIVAILTTNWDGIISNNLIKYCEGGIGVLLGNGRIQNNEIVFPESLPLENRDLTGISISGGDNILIDGNYIVAHNLPDNTNHTWDGNIGTGSNVNFNGHNAINLGGSSNATNIVVSNNRCVLKAKQNASKKYAAILNDTEAQFINNRIEGWDFAFMRVGGADTKKTSKGLTLINVERTYASPVADGLEHVFLEDVELPFYPTQIGWYKIGMVASRNSAFTYTIGVGGQSQYGSNIANDTSNYKLQHTKFSVASSGYNAATDLRLSISQHIHTSTISPIISKVYWNGSNVFLYVDNITTRFALSFSGGGGSGAAGYCTATNGIIDSGSVVVTSGGSNYTSPPTAVVAPSSFVSPIRGSGALFTASVSGNQVTSVAVNSGGSGYASPIFVKANTEIYDITTLSLLRVDGPVAAPSNGIELKFKQGIKSVSRSGGTSGNIVGSGDPELATSAPTSAPEFIGQQYINTSTGIAYIGAGTSSSADWKAISFWEP